MEKQLKNKRHNRQFITFLMVGLLSFLLSGCQQVNDVVNSNTATNNTATNSNATANNTAANSNTKANSNANANVQSNSAANANNQISNTAANSNTEQEVSLSPEAKVFKNNLFGKWKIVNSPSVVTFTEDKYEVKQGETLVDNGSYRILDEKTVEIKSVKLNRNWKATMEILNDGNTLDWRDDDGEVFELSRVTP